MSDQPPKIPSHEGQQPLSQQMNLDVYQSAPAVLKKFFKDHRKVSLGEEKTLIDNLVANYYLPGFESISKTQIDAAFDVFRGSQLHMPMPSPGSAGNSLLGKRRVELDCSNCIKESARWTFEFKQIPGLVLLPSFLPDDIQIHLLDRLLHRDLFNPVHKTNLHAHYNMVYPKDQCSYFEASLSSIELQPKNQEVHAPLSIKHALEQKLRWITLGGQYDWTNKMYPPEAPPEFPGDIASFIHQLFPDMEPQAAIVNVYSPGDKLMMHRDVSEEVDEGLVSISLGCSCIFIIGKEDKTSNKVEKLAIRLSSGDVLYMTKEARLAWHGVARIEEGTCPSSLKRWPLGDYENWMDSKRINLNVRQMRAAVVKEGNLKAHTLAKSPASDVE